MEAAGCKSHVAGYRRRRRRPISAAGSPGARFDRCAGSRCCCSSLAAGTTGRRSPTPAQRQPAGRSSATRRSIATAEATRRAAPSTPPARTTPAPRSAMSSALHAPARTGRSTAATARAAISAASIRPPSTSASASSPDLEDDLVGQADLVGLVLERLRQAFGPRLRLVGLVRAAGGERAAELRLAVALATFAEALDALQLAVLDDVGVLAGQHRVLAGRVDLLRRG